MKNPQCLIALIIATLLVALSGCASNTPQSASAEAPFVAPAGTYALKEVDAMPKPRGPRAGPVYPRMLKDDGITGEAVVRFIVNKEGRVTDVRVVKATHELFGDAAKAAVEQWNFSPAKKDGAPVNCYMQIPIMFNL
ncbi:TonB family protein [Ereboglobus sp. PH5-10]|uniref:energy transducer TonB n=1 Tax=Ereboglobus sp. PH5-10 TaxID=2940629 RepID=UPI0024068254|nr:energy transducer TonB [Ereboglobus sp. PH5-10]MDF9826932.1 TonB family protein [Ereboglobus sp. PH5-10]